MNPSVADTAMTSIELREFARTIQDRGGRFQMAYARYVNGSPEVNYLIDQGPLQPFLQISVRGETVLGSLANQFPLLSWYEREIMDTFDIEFSGHPESVPLMILEGLQIAKRGGKAFPPRSTDESDTGAYIEALPSIDQDQVQDLFWGPVRGDVLETAEFHFAYIGEEILYYQPRFFYKHRGIEEKFESTTVENGVILAERVSGVGSITHALAYCQAVEDALHIQVSRRAQLLRVVLGELERIYNNLHFFSVLSKTTTLKVGEAFGAILEEEAKRINAKLTGSRFLRSTLAVGGLRRDLNPDSISSDLAELQQRSTGYLGDLFDTQSFLDRLLDTGTLSTEVAFDFGATGPAANASGIERDLRVQHPYSLYDELGAKVALRHKGDALARAEVRREALQNSFSLINASISHLESGAVASPYNSADTGDRSGLGWCEGPRGACIYAVHLSDGRPQRVKIKSPSFSSWKAFPLTVHKTNMMDYAINEASFGLSIAGVDR